MHLPLACAALALAPGAVATAQTVAFPFSEDFESGVLQPYWTVASVGEGQVLVTDLNGPLGSFHCTMDAVTDLVESTASITLSIDLSGQQNVLLEFWHREYGDEDDPEDGVWLSDDGGISWHLAKALTSDNTSSYSRKAIELDLVTSALGLSYSSDFRIRFQWNDNYGITTDGFGFDDISIGHLPYTLLHGASGSAAYDEFAASLAAVGDLNGDGFGDLAVGIPGGDPQPPASDHGEVRLLSGADGALIHSLVGFATDIDFGRSVAALGDLNLDGYQEVLVGAPDSSLTGALSGAVFAYSGQTGLVWQGWSAVAAGDRFGSSVAGVGDVDGDGIPDLLVGAPKADLQASDAGAAVLYSGATGLQLDAWAGSFAFDDFGRCVAGAGDLNLDGIPDVLVGAPLADGGGASAGAVTAYSGATGTRLRIWQGLASYDELGTSLAGLGDLNADGYPEIGLGAPKADPNGSASGQVRVISGSDYSDLYAIEGSVAYDELGRAVTSAGDIDGDGAAEILVGAPGGTSTLAGRAELISGTSGEVLRTFHGTNNGEELGGALAGLGDVDGDGVGDLALGSPAAALPAVGTGSMRVVSCVGAPLITSIEGLLAMDAGEITIHGDNLVSLEELRIGGMLVTPSSIELTTVTVPVNPDVPGRQDLSLTTAHGSSSVEGGVARFPVLSGKGSAPLGGNTTLRLENGAGGAWVAWVSGAGLYLSPVPIGDIYHGLEIQAIMQIAAGVMDGGLETALIPLAVPSNPNLEGVHLWFQAVTSQGLVPMGPVSFTNTAEVVLVK